MNTSKSSAVRLGTVQGTLWHVDSLVKVLKQIVNKVLVKNRSTDHL